MHFMTVDASRSTSDLAGDIGGDGQHVAAARLSSCGRRVERFLPAATIATLCPVLHEHVGQRAAQAGRAAGHHCTFAAPVTHEADLRTSVYDQ